MKKIIVTGSNGFIGSRFINLGKYNYEVVPMSVRHPLKKLEPLKNADVVIHCGGLAHRKDITSFREYVNANYELTRSIAEQAVDQGVKQFIFLSSIKVFGEKHFFFDLNSKCTPGNDPYGSSKLQAETYLQSLDSTMKIAIIRPPLVYGPGVKANMFALMRLCDSWWPLPFKNISNRRSFIYVDNLVALMNEIIEQAASGIFLAGDTDPLSTSELVIKIRRALNRQNNIFALPKTLRRLIALLRPGLSKRLYESLEMDTSESYDKLKFKPPHSSDHGIEEMVRWYKKTEL